MPTHYKRRRTGGSRLTWSSYKLGQLVDRAAAVEREDANWQRAQAVLGNPDTSGLNAARDGQGLRGMAGRGAYWGKVAGGALGTAAGNYFGLGKAGGSIGAKMGDWASDRVEDMFRGKGLYQGSGGYTHSNALVSGVDQDMVHRAQVASYGGFGDEQGAIVIKNKEYIQDVYAPGVTGSGISVPFSNQSYNLNPGLQSTFTFLSQVAQNYDEYQWIQLLFTFRSTTTDIGTTTTGQCGTIIMCTNYNAAAPKFLDKQSMVEYSGAHSCKLTEHMVHGVECDPSKSAMSPSLFVRANPVVTGQDLKTYDKGLFQFATANCPSAFNGLPIGELWVEYTVILRKPKLFTSRGLEIDQDLFNCTTIFNASTATNGSRCLDPLGSAFSVQPANCVGQQNNIGCAVYSNGENISLFAASPLTITAVSPSGSQWFEGAAVLTAATTLPAGYIAVVFPAAYVGNVSITLTFSSAQNFSVRQNMPYACNNIGNISPIRDLYAYSNSAVMPTYVSSGQLPTALGAVIGASDAGYQSRWDMFVSASSGGVNNVFIIQVIITAADQNIVGLGSLSISQYQGNNITNTTQRVPFVSRTSGVVQVPVNTV